MKSGQILNNAQAVAVRDAMCALNNVNAHGDSSVTIAAVNGSRSACIHVRTDADGLVEVVRSSEGEFDVETYDSQSEFFAAYGVE